MNILEIDKFKLRQEYKRSHKDMKNNDYYTPRIEEFHVGFEFEIIDLASNNYGEDKTECSWDKRTLKEEDFYSSYKEESFFSTVLRYLNKGWVRVKCPNKKDKNVSIRELTEQHIKDMTIFNGTPHPIHIIKGAVFKAEIRKYIGGKIVTTIPSNGMLSAEIYTNSLGTYNDIPVFNKGILGCDPLPVGYDVIIVSQLYASALRASGELSNNVYTVADPVYSEDGKSFMGCLGICQLFNFNSCG